METEIKNSGFELFSERWIHVLILLLGLFQWNSNSSKELPESLLSWLSPELKLRNNIVGMLDALVERPVSKKH